LRSRKILHALVSEYIATGEAVGSRTITRRHGIDLSPATVRNVMADLEEIGLVRQPHTSAGRVPTERGLRVFIDSLLRVRSLSAEEKEQIAIRVQLDGAGDLDEIMRETSRLLSELSRHTALVLTPRPEANVFEHIEFVRLRPGELLAVLVTTTGQVHNRLVSLDGISWRPGERGAPGEPLEQAELERIHNYLNGLLSGLTLEQVRQKVLSELGREKNDYDQLVARALCLGAAALPESSTVELLVDGKANLLDHPAHDDREKMKALFRAVEDKQLLLRLLDKTAAADGVQVFLGAETKLVELADSAVVSVAYGTEGQPFGALGVIGPARMNYSKVIPLVDFVARLVSGVVARR
jgi:heat-inducible transcriptional repressor